MNSVNAGNSQKPSRGARRVLLGFAGAAAAVSLAAGLAGMPAFAAGIPSSHSSSESDQAIAASAQTSTDKATSTDVSNNLAEQVASKVLPSVGTVTCQVVYEDSVAIASGSCEVLDTEGHILTNYHVVAGATDISVNINDTDYEATLVGSDPTSDIAVLKIEADDLTPIEIGSSSDLKAGEWVMTVGAPMGEEHSVSQGIVSGLDRSASVSLEDGTTVYYPGLIQSDAMINSGSSGGALVDSDGKLVGITTLNYSTSGDFAGMSAAIPVDYATGIIDQILKDGQAEHPYMGIFASDVTPYNYRDAGSTDTYFGSYVNSVVTGSPADEAGVQGGDIITKVDGEEIYDAAGVIVATRQHEVGDDMVLTIQRDGKELELTVTLESDLDNSVQTGVSSAAGDAVTEAPYEDDTDGFGGLGDIFSIFGGDDQGSNDDGSYGYGWSDGPRSYGRGGGYDYGYGPGYGMGNGMGNGMGMGDGYGPGYGYGDGTDDGYGHMYGPGYGYGDGGSYGVPYGRGYGMGNGMGYGMMGYGVGTTSCLGGCNY